MLENSLSFSNEQPAHQPFNGIAALQAHLDQRKVVEVYVDGKSTNMPSLPTSCTAVAR